MSKKRKFNNFKKSQNLLKSGTGNTQKSRNWMFTLNNYSKNDISELKNLKNCEFVFQEEIGEKNKIPHLQGTLMFKTVKSFEWMKKLVGGKMHLERVKYKKECIDYCMKINTRSGKVFTNIKDLKIPKMLITEYKPWQKQLIEDMKNVNNREIIWYWDYEGNTGKTTFARHWYRLHKNNCLYVCGKASDMKRAVVSEMERGNDIEYIILDCARGTNPDYPGIEQLKNGFFFSGKYESGMYDSENEIIKLIVFANMPPEEDYLSKDRWKFIRKINDIK